MSSILRRLGASDLEISTVGLGTSAIAGTMWGAQSDDESIRAIHEAVDGGVNWIHTGGGYGMGHAEMVVGRALATLPADRRPYVFGMAGFEFDETTTQYELGFSLRPENIRQHVEDSLARLGIERLDLLQFHWPDKDVPIEESWGSVGSLVAEGKVRLVGLSNHPVELLERAERIRHVDAIQTPLSLLDRSMNGPYGDRPKGQLNGNSGGPDVLDWSRAHNTGILAYAALQHGLLSGTFTRERAESGITGAGETLRPSLYWFREPELSRALDLVEGLRPIAHRRGASVAALAIAWTLGWRGVTGSIVGARRPAQLGPLLEAMHLDLDAEDYHAIGQEIRRSGVGQGTPGDGPAEPV